MRRIACIHRLQLATPLIPAAAAVAAASTYTPELPPQQVHTYHPVAQTMRKPQIRRP